MKIKIQDSTPYDRSLIWEIQASYFQRKGADAWLDGQIPYNITCNSCAAYQNAFLVYQAVENMIESGRIQPEEPINVLEVASGLGLFASYFICEFQSICRENQRNHFERLVYYFTDYSRQNLRDAMKNEHLQALKNEGKVRFAVLDASNPQEMEEMGEDRKIAPIPLAAAIANYVHCCLPMTVWRKDNGKFHEKYLELYIEADGKDKIDNLQEYVRRITEQATDGSAMEKIERKSQYKPLQDKVLHAVPEDWAAISRLVQDHSTTTIGYPYVSLKAIREMLPWLKKGGIYLISDKGYGRLQDMLDDEECLPSIHGNSIAHCVNFPLLEVYAHNLGCHAYRTGNPEYSLQTILFDTGPSRSVEEGFSRLFIHDNPNQESADFYSAATHFDEENDYENAAVFYKKTLRHRRHDSEIYFKMGDISLDLKNYERAIEYYRQGQNYDFFCLYDFDFNIGRACYYLDRYQDALDHYKLSLNRWGVNKQVYYNLGLCYEQMGCPAEAKTAFGKALEIDPHYDKAKEGMERLGELKRDRHQISLKSGYHVEAVDDKLGEMIQIKTPEGKVCLTMTFPPEGPSVELNSAALNVSLKSR